MGRFLKNTAIVFLVFVTLVGTLELLYHVLKIPKITHHDIYGKAQQLIPQVNKNTILIVGDSKLEWGINPVTLQQKISADSIKIINMAMPGSNGLDVLRYLQQNNIYPKLILLGYSSNYGGYKNHGFDKQVYSGKNKLSEQLGYFMDENFYFRDQSVMEYIKHGHPYFKSHAYDALGGATVTEYGDYATRATGQVAMYKAFKNSFNPIVLDNYFKEADTLVQFFRQKGSIVCGVYMPVSKKIYEIQHASLNLKQNPVNYDKYYDYSKFTYTNEAAGPDSLFFLDGCHLSHQYSIIFSEKLISRLQADFPVIR